jgi:hypothetical protein
MRESLTVSGVAALTTSVELKRQVFSVGRLEDKTASISGAAGSIGAATARRFVARAPGAW